MCVQLLNTCSNKGAAQSLVDQLIEHCNNNKEDNVSVSQIIIVFISHAENKLRCNMVFVLAMEL